LEIHSNDPDTPTIEISLTAALPATTPDISVAPTSLDFGVVMIGEIVTKEIKITNNGSGDLVITLSGLAGTDFSISGSPNITIKSKESYFLQVTFARTSAGLKTATLKIDSNDPDTPTIEISLSGTGPSEEPPDIGGLTPTLDFGSIKVGTNATKTLKPTNYGSGNLVITLSGLAGTDFSISGSTNITIKSKKSYDLAVTFTPKSAGLKTATLEIHSNDPDTPTIDISLSGTGQTGQ
jgi:preprotein translocase subunit YajC